MADGYVLRAVQKGLILDTGLSAVKLRWISEPAIYVVHLVGGELGSCYGFSPVAGVIDDLVGLYRVGVGFALEVVKDQVWKDSRPEINWLLHIRRNQELVHLGVQQLSVFDLEMASTHPWVWKTAGVDLHDSDLVA